MPSSPTPGSPTSICSRTSMPTWPSPTDQRLGTPDTPAIRSTRVSHFVASLVRFRYGLPGCSPPCTDRTGTPQPSGTFTSRLSTDRSPSPSLDITTTVTGLLCWRDFHPLEWQLASLHQIRTGPIRAYGLYGAFFVKWYHAIFVFLCHSILLFDPRREHSSAPTAYFHRRRAQRRSRTALLQRRRRLVLDGREHGGRLPAIGWLAAR